MRTYRICILDDVGHITLSRSVRCADDLAALEQAQTECIGHGVEVWLGNFGAGALRHADALAQKYRRAGDMHGSAVWNAVADAIRQRQRVRSTGEDKQDQSQRP